MRPPGKKVEFRDRQAGRQACMCVQSCPILCNPMDYSLPGKNTGVGYHFLLRGIFPTQGLNPCLLHWRVDSLPLRDLGSPQSDRSGGKSCLCPLSVYSLRELLYFLFLSFGHFNYRMRSLMPLGISPHSKQQTAHTVEVVCKWFIS